MARKIAVALTKGGVGKTTTAVSLAHGLAMHGYKTLLVDTDTQGQCSRALGVEPEATLANVLADHLPAAEAITEARDNLYLLASDHHLAGPALDISRDVEKGHRALAEALKPVAGRFDYIILDAAPGFDPMAINVLTYASEVLAPVSLEPAAMVGLLGFVNHLDKLRKLNRRLALKYILPTFLDARSQQPAQMLEQIRQHFPDQVCQPVRVNVQIAEAFGWQKTILEYAPGSRGAKDYLALTERILSDG